MGLSEAVVDEVCWWPPLELNGDSVNIEMTIAMEPGMDEGD